MINCKEAVTRMWSYLDRNLGRVEEQELEAHLGLCRHCCGELEFAKQIRDTLRGPEGGSGPRSTEIPPEARGRLDAFLKSLGEKP